jgi:ABC-type multidrug transport system fused ATPase/permease subunit
VTALSYLRHLIAFAFRRNRALYLYVLTALASAICELVAMASLVPLATLAQNGALVPGSKSARILRAVGIAPGLKQLVLLFIGLLAVRVATNILSQGLGMKLGRRILAQLSSEAFDTVLRVIPVREIEEKSIGHFIGMAGDEAFRASATIIALCQLVSFVFLGALYYGAIVAFSAKLALGVAAFLAVSALCLGGVIRRSHALGVRAMDQARAGTTFFVDALNGLRSTRAFSAEAYVSEGQRAQIFRYVHTLFLVDFLQVIAKSAPVLLLLATCAAVSLVLPSTTWATVNVATIITIIVIVMRFFPVVGSCLNILLKIVSDASVGKDLTDLIGKGQRLKAERREGVPLGEISRVSANALCFSYNGTTPVLKDVSFQLERGKSYSIAGPSGAGKSTLVDLLMKFYPLQGGDIVIDGESLAATPDARLRERVLLLGQTSTILNDTIRNNIAFGHAASDADIEAAARLAVIDELIDGLPNGYDTLLQYQGTNLSGGQRQRIGLARALLRTPDLLILDESTGALDAGTREQVVTNILRTFRDRIVVFITHDPEIWKRTDEVIELRPVSCESEAPPTPRRALV